MSFECMLPDLCVSVWVSSVWSVKNKKNKHVDKHFFISFRFVNVSLVAELNLADRIRELILQFKNTFRLNLIIYLFQQWNIIIYIIEKRIDFSNTDPSSFVSETGCSPAHHYTTF